MALYVTLSRGGPGDEVTPILASSDPEVVSRFVQILLEVLGVDVREARAVRN